MPRSTKICHWVFGIILAYAIIRDNWLALIVALWWFIGVLGCHFFDEKSARKEAQLELARREALNEANHFAE